MLFRSECPRNPGSGFQGLGFTALWSAIAEAANAEDAIGGACLGVPPLQTSIPIIQVISGGGSFIGLECRKTVVGIERCLECICRAMQSNVPQAQCLQSHLLWEQSVISKRLRGKLDLQSKCVQKQSSSAVAVRNALWLSDQAVRSQVEGLSRRSRTYVGQHAADSVAEAQAPATKQGLALASAAQPSSRKKETSSQDSKVRSPERRMRTHRSLPPVARAHICGASFDRGANVSC